MSTPPPSLSTLLPREVRLALAAAAKLADPFERSKAINRAIAKARLTHPQFFRSPKS